MIIINSLREPLILMVLIIIVIKFVEGTNLCSQEILLSYQIGETEQEDFSSEAKQDFSLEEVFDQMRTLNNKIEKGKMGNQESESMEKYLTRENLLEGDILVDSQYTLLKIVNESQSLYGPSSLLGEPWPNGEIPFVFHDNYSLADQMAVTKAMKEIHSVSCVRFKMRSNEDYFIRFYKADGCSSHVGFQKIVQGLSLTDDCLNHHSIILHMLMHALGFWHETTRADRDKYIKINWKNINPKFWCNYRRFHSMSWKQLHYDGDSILHYSQRSFSKDENDAKKATFQFIDGDRVLDKKLLERPAKLSKLDIKKILIKYDCYSRNWQHETEKEEREGHEDDEYEDISDFPIISGRMMKNKGEENELREKMKYANKIESDWADIEKPPIGSGLPRVSGNQLEYDGGTIDLHFGENRASSRFRFMFENSSSDFWFFLLIHILLTLTLHLFSK